MALIDFHIKYQELLNENRRLKEENERLKSQLEKGPNSPPPDSLQNRLLPATPQPETSPCPSTIVLPDSGSPPAVTNLSDPAEKIKLFMSLFKGRADVYARRWENTNTGKSGYAPYCLNQWKPGICSKLKKGCPLCTNKAYAVLDEKAISNHLTGDIVIGIYPMSLNETCYFLAIDFDEADWQKDISALGELCREFRIPVAIERSRSGNGGHAWFFFENQISAALARRLGTALITHCMERRHEVSFQSYDRFFPSQDTLPKGGFGNLIALPLQKRARADHNSEFVNESFIAFEDQWAFLSAIEKAGETQVNGWIKALSPGNELGLLKVDDEEPPKPWEIPPKKELFINDFPIRIEVVKANMLFVPKAGISQRALNRLKRLASFKNPEFFKKQAMRLPTFKTPRIISCSDETTDYLCLPRGCEEELKAALEESGVEVAFSDKTHGGRKIDVAFNGVLREDQAIASTRLLSSSMGILSGTTAFGKTVVAIHLIAERKVNALILVDKTTLLSQWQEKLDRFLVIREPFPEKGEGIEKKRGRKKKITVIGHMRGGKDHLSGIIDVAVMQSLNRKGEVKRCVADYGMIIVDECHHVSAFSFEKILKTAPARYVYGLTATPERKDGHHPIITMQCGPIRYRDDARKQAEERPFDHFMVPRFTPFRAPLSKDEKEVTIQELYKELTINEMRNRLIVEDVVQCHENGRNAIVLTQRTAHIALLVTQLKEKIPDVIPLMGKMGARQTCEALNRITHTPVDRPLTIVSTGKYIGEGFDEPRLDTLFLAMPISWKGTLQQYAGRLHRLFAHKKEVLIYDYVDIHVQMLEKMYHRRLSGYGLIGYKIRGASLAQESIDIIFDKENFLPVYGNDLMTAKREIVIVSPFITRRRTEKMMGYLKTALGNGVGVAVITRPESDFKERNRQSFEDALVLLKESGIRLIFRSGIHQKFAIMDQRIVWYGSINLLSYGNAEESVMRIENPNIACELIKIVST